MARLLIWCLVWIQVHWSKKGSCWKHFWSNGEQTKKVAITSRRPHVATSPRRDVPTSRRPHVATSPRRDVRSTMQKSTIRNVVTFERRDVSTSQRRDISTSQRRDVSTGSALHHLKHKWFGMGGIGRRTNEGTEFHSRVMQTSKKCP